MHQPSGRHRRPRRTLVGQAWAIAAALLSAALTFVFVPQTPRWERTALPPAPNRPRLPAAPVSPEPTPTLTRLAREPGVFPGHRLSETSARWANGYRDTGPEEDAGPLARPYMPPPPEPRPLVPLPRVPEGDLLANPSQDPPRPVSEDPDNLNDLAAVIRTYLATVG
ncbi:hypothetical protein GCM10007079_52000 [Nocardiopsis terrae]|uniref:Uncharacterized protein n=1 Tax=Nocardiopsis terrae TaxID=372655 RepID=A0ABR9HAX7_9ACTN|nr:hypothetical protein [Nocardiopsis terrae]MBE1456175.1 hypothetical protein [Nocardiopsis terrae]GHC98005.1 hypothetical protein GCM10007079_52000 [Nocardiopsis terrae]